MSQELIPIVKIAESPTNPRKRFDSTKLQELAESIKVHGVLQAVVVRPDLRSESPAEYELVVGARRFRASQLAGAETIKADIQDLSDEQVLELQLLENNQREDVHPLEEAEAMRRCVDSGMYGSGKAAVEKLAGKLGKSIRWVYDRLSLLKLTDEAKEDFFSGRISQAHAVELARYSEKQQTEAITKLIWETNWKGERLQNKAPEAKISVRDLRNQLTGKAFVNLGDARFNRLDAELLPRAGACESCPNFDSSEDLGERCFNPRCFGDKTRAHNERLIATARAKYPDAWLVSLSYSKPKSKDCKQQYVDYRHSREGEKGAELAIVGESISGDQIGETIWITRVRKTAQQEGKTANELRWEAEKREREQEVKRREAIYRKCIDRIGEFSGTFDLEAALRVVVRFLATSKADIPVFVSKILIPIGYPPALRGDRITFDDIEFIPAHWLLRILLEIEKPHEVSSAYSEPRNLPALCEALGIDSEAAPEPEKRAKKAKKEAKDGQESTSAPDPATPTRTPVEEMWAERGFDGAGEPYPPAESTGTEAVEVGHGEEGEPAEDNFLADVVLSLTPIENGAEITQEQFDELDFIDAAGTILGGEKPGAAYGIVQIADGLYVPLNADPESGAVTLWPIVERARWSIPVRYEQLNGSYVGVEFSVPGQEGTWVCDARDRAITVRRVQTAAKAGARG